MPAKVVSIHDDTEARRRIRESLHESLIVEAAAGTGKTSELVGRIVYMLESGLAKVDRIVAVTFTNKAAGELKLRLRAGLDRRLQETSGESAANLRDALAHLEEASIGTIHAFCAQVLRERPVEACVDPAFEELNELQSGQLRNKAFQGWFQQRLNEDSPALRRALMRLAGGATPASEQLKYAAKDLIEWRDYPADWTRRDWDREAELDSLVERILDAAPKVSSAFQPIKATAQWITRYEAVRERDYDALEALLVKLRADLRREKRKGVEDLQYALEQFRRNADADLAVTLRAEMLEIVDRYQQLKWKQGKLDFLDLLILARDLIRDDTNVRRYLQNRFTHVFVDEFQDTDPVQAEFLLLLSSDDPDTADWEKVSPVAGKLFVVGDPKQSIYKFRRADVVLYEKIKRRLRDCGVGVVNLTRSFRSVDPIQRFVNDAFEKVMQPDEQRGQAGYIPLRGGPETIEAQPGLVALPVPNPYGSRRISRQAIEQSLPAAVVAKIDWLLSESGWTIRDPSDPSQRIPVAARHICVLFRRFTNFRQDLTREYARGLEARGIPHLLVGSKSFHHREEVETLRAALTAIEWPEDELCAFATLKGSLFAIGDAALLRWRAELGRLHPFGARPKQPDAELQPIADALDFLAELHRLRNRRPAAETVNLLLEAARAHAAFAMRPAGYQVLANVYRVAELARVYEASGGISFRGFVEHLEEQTQKSETSEAPILEEGAEGVRLMTVHAAKGLEFPVVILADITARLSNEDPERYVDSQRRICASRLLWCSPTELLEHQDDERIRERAEGVRVAYVAATRARDLLVVPAVGDGPLGDSWLEPLDSALYPVRGAWRKQEPAPGCPKFGNESILDRPKDLEPPESVRPGVHLNSEGTAVVWWDPAVLRLEVDSQFGIRHEDILREDGTAQQSLADYEDWKLKHLAAQASGARPAIDLTLASQVRQPPADAPPVEVLTLSRMPGRPSGRRFGVMVHGALRDATPETVKATVRLQSRLAGASPEETDAAEAVVSAVLAHPLLARARASQRVLRETPVTLQLEDGGVLDGVIDLAFVEDGAWTVVDFKTDADAEALLKEHSAQLQWYALALQKLTGLPARGVLLAV